MFFRLALAAFVVFGLAGLVSAQPKISKVPVPIRLDRRALAEIQMLDHVWEPDPSSSAPSGFARYRCGMTIRNGTSCEITGVTFRLSIFELPSDSLPLFTTDFTQPIFRDRLVGLEGTLLPGFTMWTETPMVITAPADKALGERGALKLELVAATGWTMSPDYKEPRHWLADVARRDASKLKKNLSEKPSLALLSDKAGTDAAHIAAALDDVETLKLLKLQGARLSAGDAEGIEPVHVAARFGSLKSLEYLLENDATVEELGNGNSPLWFAVEGDSKAAIDVLLNKGAKVDERNKLGDTPLMFAEADGSRETCAFLVQSGADVNARALNGATAVYSAVLRNDPDRLGDLIKAGALINVRMSDDNQWSPLHWAARLGSTSCLKELLRAGSDLKLKDGHGRTAADLANAYNHAATAQALELAALGKLS